MMDQTKVSENLPIINEIKIDLEIKIFILKQNIFRNILKFDFRIQKSKNAKLMKIKK